MSRLNGIDTATFDAVVIGGPGAARRVRRAPRERRLRLRHVVEVVQADPRRAALPRALRHPARAGVASREEDARAAGAAPRAPAALPRPRVSRLEARAHHGAHRHVALRSPDAGQGEGALPLGPLGGRARARALDPGPGPSRRRLLFRRPAALPRAALPRERALGIPPRRARPQLLRGGGGHARGRRHRRRARAGPPDRPGARGARARHRQLRRALGGPAAGAGGRPGRGQEGAEDDQGHPLHAAADDGPRRLPLDGRRPHDLRDPVARVFDDRHDGHRLRRRPGSSLGHARRGRVSAGGGSPGAARPARGLRPGCLHVRGGEAAGLRGGRVRLQGLP